MGVQQRQLWRPTTECFNDLRLLDSVVDWDLQEAVMWNDTADDGSGLITTGGRQT